MGRTSKPLKILVHPSIKHWDEWSDLFEKGHTVMHAAELEDFDLVVGPTCWRLDQDHRPYVKLAIEAARKARYPNAKKEETV